jgi:hypothetical protein
MSSVNANTEKLSMIRLQWVHSITGTSTFTDIPDICISVNVDVSVSSVRYGHNSGIRNHHHALAGFQLRWTSVSYRRNTFLFILLIFVQEAIAIICKASASFMIRVTYRIRTFRGESTGRLYKSSTRSGLSGLDWFHLCSGLYY